MRCASICLEPEDYYGKEYDYDEDDEVMSENDYEEEEPYDDYDGRYDYEPSVFDKI